MPRRREFRKNPDHVRFCLDQSDCASLELGMVRAIMPSASTAGRTSCRRNSATMQGIADPARGPASLNSFKDLRTRCRYILRGIRRIPRGCCNPASTPRACCTAASPEPRYIRRGARGRAQPNGGQCGHDGHDLTRPARGARRPREGKHTAPRNNSRPIHRCVAWRQCRSVGLVSEVSSAGLPSVHAPSTEVVTWHRPQS